MAWQNSIKTKTSQYPCFSVRTFFQSKCNIFLSLAIYNRSRGNQFYLKYQPGFGGQEKHWLIYTDIDKHPYFA